MNRRQEQRLIERAAAGDRAAAESLIRAHQYSLYAYLLRMSGRPEAAEDIVQEAFVRVLTNLERFDPRFRFSTWLFTIAKRLYLNAAARMKPAYGSDMVDTAGGVGLGPDRPAIAGEVAANATDAIAHALAVLPDVQREVVILFHQLDWPVSVIAQHMDIPVGTVKSHLHRGRRRMREALARCEVRVARVAEVWT
ncbi:MAG: RNA polymerase sigma factor [Phycisphaerales bacterium]